MARARALLVVLAAVLTVVYLVLPAGPALEVIRVVSPAIGCRCDHARNRVVPAPAHPAMVADRVLSMGLLAPMWSGRAVLRRAGRRSRPRATPFISCRRSRSCSRWDARGRQETSSDEDSLGIETAIVGIAVGLGVWLAVVEPYLTDRDLAVGDRVWAVLVPMLGAVALALSVRLAIPTRFRAPAPTLLMIGVSMLLIADVLGASVNSARVTGPEASSPRC
jgi:hypothetical protein